MGRTPYRHFFTLLLLSVLDAHIPSNVEAIKRAISIKLGKKVSWNTVKKYLEELVEEGKVERIKAGKILMYKKKIL
jgi:Mn-dependent DtxR family transcriptional regulator